MLHLYQSNRLETLAELCYAALGQRMDDPYAPEVILVQAHGMGRWLSLGIARHFGICANIRFELPAAWFWQLADAMAQLDQATHRQAAQEPSARIHRADSSAALFSTRLFSREALGWRIDALLAQTPLAALTSYLGVPGSRSSAPVAARMRWRLAQELAGLYDQYLVYRADWLAAWENGRALGLGEDEAWQAELWRALNPPRTEVIGHTHRARIFNRLHTALRNVHLPLPLAVPERIVLFGISSLPLVYLELLRALAQRIEVCLFALNPCAEVWNDLASPDRPAEMNPLEDMPQDTPRDAVGGLPTAGEILLRAWGAQGRAFFDELAATDDLHSLFQDPAATPHSERRPGQMQAPTSPMQQMLPRSHAAPHAAPSLLAAVQHSVLYRTPLPEWQDEATYPSLAVHACHSAARQLETLRDVLLARFAADPSLQPAEVAVLCPDIAGFAPYIESVFGYEGGGKREDLPADQCAQTRLPYAVADWAQQAESPTTAAFLALLALPDSGWAADAMLALLESPTLARSFGFTQADLPTLRDWVRRAGIRRGRAGSPFSWQAGIGRLLLGVALPRELAAWDTRVPEEASPLFAGLLPLDDLEGVDTQGTARRLARLAAFVDTLAQWEDTLAEARTLSAWVGVLGSWVARFFPTSTPAPLAAHKDGELLAQEEAACETIRQALITLSELAALLASPTPPDARNPAGAAPPVPIAAVTLHEWFRGVLHEQRGRASFLAGGITFAQLIPMRNLPFRVIAVLGLDWDAFPRQRQTPHFDLLTRYPRRGDRSRHQDDRWLFLETLLAARESLLLFYTGRDARSDRELPPSRVIEDLRSALSRPTRDGRGHAEPMLPSYTMPLQPFAHARYRAAAPLPSFDARWFGIAQALQQAEAQEAQAVAAGEKPGQASAPLSGPAALLGAVWPQGSFPLRPVGEEPAVGGAGILSASASASGAGGQGETEGDGENRCEDEPLCIDLDELLRFANDPGRYFLRQRAVFLEREEAAPASREIFTLRQDYGLETRLLSLALPVADAGAAPEHTEAPPARRSWPAEAARLTRLGQAAALLPEDASAAPQVAQRVHWADALARWRTRPRTQQDVVLEISAEDLRLPLRPEDLPAPLPTPAHAVVPPSAQRFATAPMRLLGTLHGLSVEGMALRRIGPLREQDRIQAWLQHLMLCAAAPPGIAPHTQLVGLDAVRRYDSLPAGEARAQLGHWLAALLSARGVLLPIFPKTSLAYVAAFYKETGKDNDAGQRTATRDAAMAGDSTASAQALQAAEAAWLGGKTRGEGTYDTHRMLWRSTQPYADPATAPHFAVLAHALFFLMLRQESRPEEV